MSYFKRFTNFCGGFVAFAALLHLIGEYMMFKAPEAEGLMGKLKEFLDIEQTADFRGYAIMFALFVLSVIVGRVFERVPYISLLVSLLPLYQTVNLLSSGKLVKCPALYLFLAILHTAGNVIHAIVLDRADGRRRGFVSAGVLGAAMSLGGVWLWNRANEMSTYEDPFAMEELGRVELKIAIASQDGFQELILKLAVMVGVSVLISLILRDIYFIDAILSAVPLVYTIQKVLLMDKLVIFEELTIILCALYFGTRVALAVFEPMRVKKKRQKATAVLDNKSEEMV